MKRKKGWMSLKVNKIVEETWDTKTFYFIDADDGEHAFDYTAGQYLTFRFDGIEDKPLVRSYTMSSSPCQSDHSACTVKRVEGGVVSNWMCDHLKEGDILKARGPIGRFVYSDTTCLNNLVMVGAGSGVTPFISILREYGDHLGKPGAPKTLTLLVAYRSQQDLICWDVLQSFKDKPGIKIITTLTREAGNPEGFWMGRPDDAMLSRLLDGHYEDTTFMSCGPEALMNMVIQHATSHGVAEEQAQTESFF